MVLYIYVFVSIQSIGIQRANGLKPSATPSVKPWQKPFRNATSLTLRRGLLASQKALRNSNSITNSRNIHFHIYVYNYPFIYILDGCTFYILDGYTFYILDGYAFISYMGIFVYLHIHFNTIQYNTVQYEMIHTTIQLVTQINYTRIHNGCLAVDCFRWWQRRHGRERSSQECLVGCQRLWNRGNVYIYFVHWYIYIFVHMVICIHVFVSIQSIGIQQANG